MTSFANDADLMPYDPGAFIDLAGVAQTLIERADGQLHSVTLTSATGGFDALSVGHVLVIRSGPAAGMAAPIAAVTDANTVELASPPVGLGASTGLTVLARTFAPQARQVHEQLLRSIGIDADDPQCPLTVEAIVSTALMRRLEALGTLAMAYQAATSAAEGEPGWAAKAASYEQRFARAVASARVLIDTDGDGLADAWRSPVAGRLVRR